VQPGPPAVLKPQARIEPAQPQRAAPCEVKPVMTEEDLAKPQILVDSAYGMGHPGTFHFRPLIEEKDAAAAEVHHLQITDAKLHYHERTDEIYYVIDGQGRMRLGDKEFELHKDVVVYVPRGVKHKAWGNLTVLVVCIPRGVLQDVHELE